jgi:hypothetical protein
MQLMSYPAGEDKEVITQPVQILKYQWLQELLLLL